MEALVEAAELASDPEERDRFLREAAEVKIPERLRLNVPVQVDRAKLAARMGDRVAFDIAIANLAQTRIDPSELDRIRGMLD